MSKTILRSASRWLVLPMAVTLLAACGEDSATGPEGEAAAASGVAAGLTGSGSASGSSTTGATRAAACNGTLGAVSVAEVQVPRNATCVLNGTRVRGNVTIAAGGTVTATAARIDGNVQGEDAAAITLQGATTVNGDVQAKRRALVTLDGAQVNGDVQVEEGGASLVVTGGSVRGDVQVKKAGTADVRTVRITGNLQFEENLGALVATGVEVRGDFQVSKNLGGVTLTDNRVAQVLECKENRPAPVGSGNVAGEKQEQCRAL